MPPASSAGPGRSPRASHVATSAATGARRLNGATSDAEWRARRNVHAPKPKSVEIRTTYSSETTAGPLSDPKARAIAPDPSKANDSPVSGIGPTRLAQMRNANPSDGFAIRVQMLLTPQEAPAATTRSTAPRGTLCARPPATTASPANTRTAQLKARRPLTEEGDGQRDREHDLKLQDERREPCRHADVDCDEEQSELTDAEEEADRDDPPCGNRRPAHEQHSGERGQRKAERDEEQRRERLEADVDGHEVDPPQQRDERCEQVMAKRH
jgi:hypothetical protein